jgi:hypothetical protein
MNRMILLVLLPFSIAWVSGTQPPPPWIKQEGPAQSSSSQSGSSGQTPSSAPSPQNLDAGSADSRISMYQEQISLGEAQLSDLDAKINEVQQQITLAVQNYESILAQLSQPPPPPPPPVIQPPPAPVAEVVKATNNVPEPPVDSKGVVSLSPQVVVVTGLALVAAGVAAGAWLRRGR